MGAPRPEPTTKRRTPVALEPREAEIRGWVEQGRSDARIGERLGKTAAHEAHERSAHT